MSLTAHLGPIVTATDATLEMGDNGFETMIILIKAIYLCKIFLPVILNGGKVQVLPVGVSVELSLRTL